MYEEYIHNRLKLVYRDLKLVYPDLKMEFDYELDNSWNKIDIYIPDLRFGFSMATNLLSDRVVYDGDYMYHTYKSKERKREKNITEKYGIKLHTLWIDDHYGKPYDNETIFGWIDDNIQKAIKEQGKDPNQYPYTNPTKVKEEAERKAKEKERIYKEKEGKFIEIVIGVIFGLVILGSILNAMYN